MASAPRQVVRDPVEGVARAGEGIDDQRPAAVRRSRGDGGDVPADRVCERIPRALDCRSAEQADTPGVPLGRPHAEKSDVVGIAEAVGAVALHLPQLQHLMPLGAQQQQVPVIPFHRP